jgi:stage II sporulation protein D
MRGWRGATRAVVGAFAALAVTLPSAAFGSSLVVINGHGWGHGVGLSQWGAEGYAQHGWGFKRVLSHYYPHTTIASAPTQQVRVQLADEQAEVTVGSARPFVLVDARGRTIHIPARSLRLTARLRFGKNVLVPPIAFAAGAAPLTYDGAGYRGSLTLDRTAGQLAVVNTLPLERYLRGVVPSEMPADWSAAAYKAQAVAARSYALASLHPAATFDLYADTRSQAYGGIPAERPETNLAVGATAGKVLTYDDRVIAAYYDSDSGGRTAAVQDSFAGHAPEPYLVSVSDPFDRIDPHQHWRVALSSAELSKRFDMPIADVQVQLNPSGRASSVRLVAGSKTRTLAAADFSSTLSLRSTYLTIGVASLLTPRSHTRAGQALVLHGFLRGLVGVVLQRRTPSGAWVHVRHVVASPSGRFVATVYPGATTAYRLAVDRLAGPAVAVEVTAAHRR